MQVVGAPVRQHLRPATGSQGVACGLHGTVDVGGRRGAQHSIHLARGRVDAAKFLSAALLPGARDIQGAAGCDVGIDEVHGVLSLCAGAGHQASSAAL